MSCLPTRLESFPTPMIDLGPRLQYARLGDIPGLLFVCCIVLKNVEQTVTFCLEPPRHFRFHFIFFPLTSSRHTTRSLAGRLTLFSPDTTAPRPPAREQPLSPRRVPFFLTSHSG